MVLLSYACSPTRHDVVHVGILRVLLVVARMLIVLLVVAARPERRYVRRPASRTCCSRPRAGRRASASRRPERRYVRRPAWCTSRGSSWLHRGNGNGHDQLI